MKKSRFTDSQIMAILKQAEARGPVANQKRLLTFWVNRPVQPEAEIEGLERQTAIV